MNTKVDALDRGTLIGGVGRDAALVAAWVARSVERAARPKQLAGRPCAPEVAQVPPAQ
jgi:hypothetical protein